MSSPTPIIRTTAGDSGTLWAVCNPCTRSPENGWRLQGGTCGLGRSRVASTIQFASDGYTVDGIDAGGAPIPVFDLEGNPLAWS